MIFLDPFAGGKRRFARHVLAGSVTRRVVETQMPQRPNRILIDVLQLARPRRRLRGGLDRVEILFDPFAEFARLQRVLPDEYRRALHILLDDRGLHAPTFGEKPHTAAIARNKRSFRGRHGYKKIALGMFAIDAQRSGKADRYLGHSDEILDIARQHGRREGILADMFELDAGLLLDKAAALGSGIRRVVVLFVARNARAVDRRMHRHFAPPFADRLDTPISLHARTCLQAA